jgi:ABC-type glycerol-3-phosphate transport system permease component
MAAVSVIAVLPTVLAAVFFQRHVVAGLTRGAVKE